MRTSSGIYDDDDDDGGAAWREEEKLKPAQCSEPLMTPCTFKFKL